MFKSCVKIVSTFNREWHFKIIWNHVEKQCDSVVGMYPFLQGNDIVFQFESQLKNNIMLLWTLIGNGHKKAFI